MRWSFTGIQSWARDSSFSMRQHQAVEQFYVNAPKPFCVYNFLSKNIFSRQIASFKKRRKHETKKYSESFNCAGTYKKIVRKGTVQLFSCLYLTILNIVLYGGGGTGRILNNLRGIHYLLNNLRGIHYLFNIPSLRCGKILYSISPPSFSCLLVKEYHHHVSKHLFLNSNLFHSTYIHCPKIFRNLRIKIKTCRGCIKCICTKLYIEYNV